jgi:very-short-patch-repair endonuclease
MTPAEKQLWSLLQNSKLLGCKFRRQHPISHYIADFYCHELKLIIELDGGIHNEIGQAEYDEGRTYVLQEFGIRVLRINNDELWKNEDYVLDRIESEIRNLTTPPQPSP